MEVLTAMFGAGVDLAIVVLAVVAVYLGHRLICGIRVYIKFRGARLVTCPETREAAVVEVAAKSVGMQAIWDKRCLQLSECSCWPLRKGCRQECLRQIEARPTDMRFSASCRAS
jgi:hypothetical protein